VVSQRLITAALLIPFVVGGVLFLPTSLLALAFSIIAGLAAWEWSVLSGITHPAGRASYVGLIALLLWGSLRVNLLSLMTAALVWWFLGAVWVLISGRGPGLAPAWMRGLVGVAVLVPAWRALVAVHEVSPHGHLYLLFLLGLVWAADSAAFLVGRRWGSRRLAPRISPGKTWEGAWAGLLAGLFLSVLAAPVLGLGGVQWVRLIGLGTATVVFAMLGDLLESMCKRVAGVKDSGRLLPGHGGVLDRVDSLTAAAPLFMLGLFWLEAAK
jgi:phosphatidate cytidylyltransferase